MLLGTVLVAEQAYAEAASDHAAFFH